MEFTSNILLSLLMPYRGRPYISSSEKKVYRWASLLPDTLEEMEPDMLYVCKLSDAMMRKRNDLDCHFVCVCDRYLSDEDRDNEEVMHNLILVEENRSLSWLLNLIQSRFLELEEWERKMKDVLLRDGGYQDVLDVSEAYLKNALFVMDGAYRLVACSKVYRSDDPVNIALYEKGYHSPEIMQLFYEHNRFEAYFKNPGVTRGTPGMVSRYETLSKWCWNDGMPLVHVIEVFYNQPLSAESQELFEVMMEYVEICFRREQKQTQSSGQPYGRFLRDMIYNDLTDINQIADAAKRFNISMIGYFDAYRIQFQDNSKVLVGRFVQELSELLDSAKIVSRDSEVSILNIYPKADVYVMSNQRIQQLLPLLQKYEALIGVSAPFTNFTSFSHACKQAEISIQYGRKNYRLTPQPEEQKDHIYHYGNVLIYYLIDQSSQNPFNFFRCNPYMQKLNELLDYDHENNSDLADILYWFLYYERRATEVGKKLHMHRNTVTYHIQHICDMLDLQLDDYMTRQQLLNAYHYIELEETK